MTVPPAQLFYNRVFELVWLRQARDQGGNREIPTSEIFSDILRAQKPFISRLRPWFKSSTVQSVVYPNILTFDGLKTDIWSVGRHLNSVS